MKRLLVVTLMLAIVGCSKSSEPQILATGHWTGVFSTSGTATTISLVLTESGSNVTGSGNLSSSAASVAIAVTGTHAHPSISLTLTAAGFSPIDLTGTFTSAATISANLNGSGYVATAVTLTKS